MILADKVPNGIVGKMEFNFKLSHQRNKAPQAAPMLTDKIAAMFIMFFPGYETHYSLCSNIPQMLEQNRQSETIA